jgi:subtilisin family serine protease
VTDPGPDVFADLHRLLTPQRLLLDPRANGEGVRVAVVDSGIERSLLEDKFARRGQTLHPIEGAVFSADRPDPLPYEGRQSSPHGTTVADILLTVAPRARLFSADVFGPRGTCDVDVVVRALRWATETWGCKVVNLSLGVAEQRLPQPQRRQQLQRAIEEAYYKDVVVVAAAHNDHPLVRSYPAAFTPPLLCVDKGLFADPLHFSYFLSEPAEFLAHGRGYLGPFATEPATSWAAPHLAGVVARLLSLRPDLKPFEVKTLLYWLGKSFKPLGGLEVTLTK